MDVFPFSEDKVQHRVRNHAEHDSVRNRVGQRHRDDAQERGNRLGIILEFDFRYRAYHVKANDDQGRSRRKPGNRQEYRSENNRYDEKERGEDRRKPGLSSGGDARCAFDKSRRGRSSEDGSNRSCDGIRIEGARNSRKLSVRIQEAAFERNADERSERIKQIDKEEGEHHDKEVQGFDEGPARKIHGAVYRMRPRRRMENGKGYRPEFRKSLAQIAEVVSKMRDHGEKSFGSIRHVDSYKFRENA